MLGADEVPALPPLPLVPALPPPPVAPAPVPLAPPLPPAAPAPVPLAPLLPLAPEAPLEPPGVPVCGAASPDEQADASARVPKTALIVSADVLIRFIFSPCFSRKPRGVKRVTP